jgi:enoyl-CoA hydratase/carnithine racemase
MSSDGTNDELVVERRDRVVVLRLNRPEARNALNPALLEGIGSAVLAAESDADVSAIVLTGTGDRAFCAGMDLRAFASGENMGAGDPAATAAFGRLFAGQVAVPIVGAANATAVAGGLELLLGCDVIVASSEAKFGLPEVKRGLFAAGGGTTIGNRIPRAVALELVLTGDPISAARAYEVGLVNAVVPPDEVLPAAIAMAERIAANGPLALRASKELVQLAGADVARWATRRAELHESVFASEDAQEGARAFVEKRAPVWQGK